MKTKNLLYIIVFQLSNCVSAFCQYNVQINDFLKETYRNSVIPGFSVVVIKDINIVFSEAYGYENRAKGIPYSCQSISGIGSITKSFTTMAIMQLSEKGKINLEAPVIQYLPWFRTINKDRSDKITVRMLLNNTSGLQATNSGAKDLSDKALEKMVRNLNGTYLSRDPGTSYEYSNTAFCVAGLIIQTVSGKSYNQYMNENILAPLHMTLTSFGPTDLSRKSFNQGHYYGISEAIPAAYERESESGEYIPAGSLANSCAQDMGNYLIALLNNGNFKGKKIISNKSLETMWSPQISFPGLSIKDGGDGNDFSYGLGWMISTIDGRSVVHHIGSAGKTSSITMLDLRNKLAVSVLMNIDISFIDKYRYSNALSIANNILHLAAGEPVTDYGRPREKDPTLNTWLIEENLKKNYTGDYFLLSGGDNIVFYNVNLHIGIAADKQLRISIARNRQIVEEFVVDFISSANGVSRNIGLADPVQFKLTPYGEVSGLIYRGMEFSRIRHETTEKWKKVAAPDESFSLDIPSGWNSEWNKNKLIVHDPGHPKIYFTAEMIKDKQVDITTIVNQELAESQIVFSGMEHSEMIAGKNWKELSIVTGEKQSANQLLVCVTKNNNNTFIVVFQTPDGLMTAKMHQYFTPILYSIKF